MKGSSLHSSDSGSRASVNGNGAAAFGSAALAGRPTQFLVAESFLAASLEKLALAEKDGGKTPIFVDRADMLSRVAVANLAAAGGDLRAAAQSAGILPAQLTTWIQRAEQRCVPGLLDVISTPGAVESMKLRPRDGWPKNLKFEYWAHSDLKYLPPAKAALNGIPAPVPARRTDNIVPIESLPPLEPQVRRVPRTAAVVAVNLTVLPDPRPVATTAPGTVVANPIEFVREKVATSKTDMQLFIDFESRARGGHPALTEAIAPLPQIRDAFFWQLFGTHQGNLEALRGNFPNDHSFIASQLAPFGAQPDSYFIELHERAIGSDPVTRRKILSGYPDSLSTAKIEERWKIAAGLKRHPELP